jgi:hypothetical protein
MIDAAVSRCICAWLFNVVPESDHISVPRLSFDVSGSTATIALARNCDPNHQGRDGTLAVLLA